MEARDLNNAPIIHRFGPESLRDLGEYWQPGMDHHRTDQTTAQYEAGLHPSPHVMSQLQRVGLLGRKNGISA